MKLGKFGARKSLISASLVAASMMTAVVAMTPVTASAQAYPAQDIHVICAFPPGSGADVLVRFFAEKLRIASGRNIIVENKSGAGGNIAQEFVGRSKPDGYTVFIHAGSGIAANVSLFKTPVFADVDKAFQMAATINRQPFMMVVDSKSPYKNVAEVTAAMKTKGEKATYGSAAPTGTVMGELYKVVTGVKAVEVPYKSAPDGINDMISGAVDYGMHDPVFALAQQREGRMRILGISTGKRLDATPDLPTMTEQGVPMDLTGWWGVIVPKGTPKPIVDQLHTWFVAIVGAPDTKAFLNKFGGDQLIESVDEAQARLVKDVASWKKYIEVAKIQPQG